MLYDGLNKLVAPIAPTLRGTISFVCSSGLPIYCLLTRGQIMDRPEFSTGSSHSQSRTLSYAPNHGRVRSSAKESKRGE